MYQQPDICIRDNYCRRERNEALYCSQHTKKKTTEQLLESLASTDKVFYMTAAQEKSWVQNVLHLYDPSMFFGDSYRKIIRVTPDSRAGYSWVIIHTYYIEDGHIVCDTSEDDTLNFEYTSDSMPATLTIMTEDEAIARLNAVIEKQQQDKVRNYASNEEVAQIYDIVNSGKGFIALSPSNKRYLIVNGGTHTANAQEVHVVKYALLRDLVPKTYKNSDILEENSGYIYTIDNTCKKDEQGNIIIPRTKLRFNMNNLEIVSKQDVANILNRIYDAVQYSMGPYYTYQYYDGPYWPDRPWNNN